MEQLITFSFIVYEIQRFIVAFTTALEKSLSLAKSNSSYLHHFLNIYSIIVLPSLPIRTSLEVPYLYF